MYTNNESISDYSLHAPYLIHLLLHSPEWVLRRVVHVDFIDTETMKIRVALDIDLNANDHTRAYLDAIQSKSISGLIIPIGFRQGGMTSFHLKDFQGRHLSLLTLTQSRNLEDALYEELHTLQRNSEIDEKTFSATERVLNEKNSLAFVKVSDDYFERHDLGYEYNGPFGIQLKARQGRWFGPNTWGHPALLRLSLLHTHSAAAYHTEIHAPPGSFIYDRIVDAPNEFLYISLRGSFTGTISAKSGLLLAAHTQWKPATHATVYIQNCISQDEEENRQEIHHSHKPDTSGGATDHSRWRQFYRRWHPALGQRHSRHRVEDIEQEEFEQLPTDPVLNLWLGIDKSSLNRPIATCAIVIGFLFLRPILARMNVTLNDAYLSYYYQGASAFFVGLAVALLSLSLNAEEHTVTNWLYRSSRRAISLAIFICIASLGVMTASIALSSQAEPVAQTVSVYLGVAMIVPLVWLSIIYLNSEINNARAFINFASYGQYGIEAREGYPIPIIEEAERGRLQWLANVNRSIG